MAQIDYEKELKLHNHILICWSDLNSLGVARSLGEKGIKPILILLKGGSRVVENSRYVGRIIYIENEEECIDHLKEFINPKYKPFVYTCDDRHQSVLDQHYDELKDNFYFFNAGENGRVTFYMDKNNICKLAEECGFTIPKTEVVSKGELPKFLSYPVFAKAITPRDEGWKHDVGIFYNEQELLLGFESFIGDKILLQEYIEKKGEISMQGISISGGEQILLPFERMYLRFSKTAFGGYMYYQPFRNEDLTRQIKLIIQKIKYTGCFEIEFLVDFDDNLYFLEINLRFSASNYGVCYGGVNQPYTWAYSTLCKQINSNIIQPRSNRFYVVNELIDIDFIKQVGLLKWLKQFFSADCYYLWNKKDMKPGFAYWYNKIKRKLIK